MDTAEQRRHPRVSLASPLRYQFKNTHRFGSTVGLDISEGGLKFFSEEFMPIGTSMVLEICLGSMLKFINAVADVVWLRKMPHSERYQVGLKFSEIDEPYHQLVRDYIKARLS